MINTIIIIILLFQDHQLQREPVLESFSDFQDSGSEYNPDDQEIAENGSSEESETQEAEEIENTKGRLKKGRKRKYPGQTFKSRKILKNSNQDHYSVKGKLAKAKTFLDFDCMCSLKCKDRIAADIRKNIFQEFWALQTYESQNNFIAASIREEGVKRKRNKASQLRQFTRTYNLNNIRVCRNIFIKSLQISTKRVDTALKKFYAGNVKDKRGSSENKVIKKLPDETKNNVIRHITSFPTYVSHYCRGETEAKFLPSDLTLNKMYSLYLEEQNIKVAFSTCTWTSKTTY